MRGRLRAGADDARPRSRTKYGVPPAPLPRARRDRRRDLRQPARRARGRARRRPPSGSTSTTASTTSSPMPTRSPARRARALREHLGDVIRNRQLNALVRDLDLALAPTDLGRAAVGPPGRCTRSSTPWSSGCCATGSSRRSSPRRTIDDSGFDARRRAGSAPGEVAGWLADARPSGQPRRRHVRGLAGARAPATSTGLALAAADGTAAWVDVASRRRPRTTRRSSAWLGDPGAAQGAARRQGPDAGAGGPRLAAARAWSATPRSRPTSSGPTSAPTTSPTSPCATSSAS